jgi:hypothetical protein
MNKIYAWLALVGVFVVAGAMTLASNLIITHLREFNPWERVVAVPQNAVVFVLQPVVDDEENLLHISQAGCFAIYVVAGLLVVYVIVPYLVIKTGSSMGGKTSTV